MYLYSSTIAIGSKRWVYFHDTDVKALDRRELRKEALPHSSCHMFKKLTGLFHFLLHQGINISVAHRVLQLIGQESLGEIAICHNIHHIIVAHGTLLFQHSVEGMKPHIA